MTATSLPPTPAGPEPVGNWAVETHGLTKRFGDNVAVDGVELLVPRGCAFGYLGPNGAGKTTLIRVLLGLTRADAGTMSLLGHPVPKHRDVAPWPASAPLSTSRGSTVTSPGRQNLQILAAARERAARDRIGPALERVGILASRRRQGVEVLDGHASAPRRGRLPHRGPTAPDPGRADERARPGRHAGHARDDPLLGGRGPDGGVVLPSARRGRAHLRRGGHRGPGPRRPPGSDLGAAGGSVVRGAGGVLRTRAGRVAPRWRPASGPTSTSTRPG